MIMRAARPQRRTARRLQLQLQLLEGAAPTRRLTLTPSTSLSVIRLPRERAR